MKMKMRTGVRESEYGKWEKRWGWVKGYENREEYMEKGGWGRGRGRVYDKGISRKVEKKEMEDMDRGGKSWKGRK